jgi:hypothetical protein
VRRHREADRPAVHVVQARLAAGREVGAHVLGIAFGQLAGGVPWEERAEGVVRHTRET